MSNQTTLFHGGAYEITKAREPQAGLVVQVFDMEEDASSVAPMTPAEWDTFVAAGNAALGRPSTPLESRLLAAIEATDEHAETGWSIGAEAEDVAAVKGKATGLRAALAMVREQGATVPRAGPLPTGSIPPEAIELAVLMADIPGPKLARIAELQRALNVPRAGVAAALAPVLTLHAQIAEESGEERADAIEALLTALDEARATLEAAGLWPVAAPATTALRGELLMSGQTEAIDALDRLAKDGEG